MTFITDHPELREARKAAALHKLSYQNAKAARSRYSHHYRAWIVAKARVGALEVRYGA